MNSTHDSLVQTNAKAAEARSRVLEAQGNAETEDIELKKLDEDSEREKQQYERDDKALRADLEVVEADMKVMQTILQLTTCNPDTKLMLYQCEDCGNMVMLQHGSVQQMLGQLRSEVSQQYVQMGLQTSYEEALQGKRPMMLTEEQVKQLRHRHDQLRQSARTLPIS